MADQKKVHLLLVDDDPVMLQLFGGQFARKGFEVLNAHSGAEAWEMARRFKPELIVLDYRMDRMDGVETAEHLKDGPDTKDIPIIMLTNEDFSPEGVKALKEVGVDEYLHKGQPFHVIMDKVKAVLKGRGIAYEEPKDEY